MVLMVTKQRAVLAKGKLAEHTFKFVVLSVHKSQTQIHLQNL